MAGVCVSVRALNCDWIFFFHFLTCISRPWNADSVEGKLSSVMPIEIILSRADRWQPEADRFPPSSYVSYR